MLGIYNTISYCAGDPRETEIIFVNGLEFNAFARLGHALRQARHFWKEQYDSEELLLWADQVCIDQSNSSERSHQVNFMGSIYENGKQVLVSLSAEESSPGGLGWLLTEFPVEEIFNDRFHSKIQVPSHAGHPRYVELHTDEQPFTKYVLQMAHDKKSHLYWNAFGRSVLCSDWWSRAWIRQEFILPTNAHFMCTFEHLHWKAILHFMQEFSSWQESMLYSNLQEEAEIVCTLEACIVCRRRFYSSTIVRLLLAKLSRRRFAEHQLLDYLEDVHTLRASDPRDLIYSLLGMCSNNYGVQPDYSQGSDIERVLIDLAYKTNTSHGYLKTLESALRHSCKPRAYSRPSWVPDWRFDLGGRHPRHTKIDHGRFDLLQSGNVSPKSKILNAKGMLYGRLESSTGPETWEISSRSGGFQEVKTYGEAVVSDEVWMLYGADNLFIFTRKEQYHVLVAEVFELENRRLPEINDLMDEVVARTKANDPLIQDIEIC